MRVFSVRRFKHQTVLERSAEIYLIFVFRLVQIDGSQEEGYNEQLSYHHHGNVGFVDVWYDVS